MADTCRYRYFTTSLLNDLLTPYILPARFNYTTQPLQHTSLHYTSPLHTTSSQHTASRHYTQPHHPTLHTTNHLHHQNALINSPLLNRQSYSSRQFSLLFSWQRNPACRGRDGVHLISNAASRRTKELVVINA